MMANYVTVFSSFLIQFIYAANAVVSSDQLLADRYTLISTYQKKKRKKKRYTLISGV
jgi:hypothetical protein